MMHKIRHYLISLVVIICLTFGSFPAQAMDTTLNPNNPYQTKLTFPEISTPTISENNLDTNNTDLPIKPSVQEHKILTKKIVQNNTPKKIATSGYVLNFSNLSSEIINKVIKEINTKYKQKVIKKEGFKYILTPPKNTTYKQIEKEINEIIKRLTSEAKIISYTMDLSNLTPEQINELINTINSKYNQEIIKRDGNSFIFIVPGGKTKEDIEGDINTIINGFNQEGKEGQPAENKPAKEAIELDNSSDITLSYSIDLSSFTDEQINEIISVVNSEYGQEVIKKEGSLYLYTVPEGKTKKDIDDVINETIKNFSEYEEGAVLVKFKDGTTPEQIDELNARLNTGCKSNKGLLYVLQIKDGTSVIDKVEQFKTEEIVEYAEPNYIRKIMPEVIGEPIQVQEQEKSGFKITPEPTDKPQVPKVEFSAKVPEQVSVAKDITASIIIRFSAKASEEQINAIVKEGNFKTLFNQGKAYFIEVNDEQIEEAVKYFVSKDIVLWVNAKDILYENENADLEGEYSVSYSEDDIEIVEEREPNKQVFQRPDGTRYERVYSGPIFYQAEDGSFKKINNNLSINPQTGNYENTAGENKVVFTSNTTKDPLVTFTAGDLTYTLSLVDALESTSTLIDDNRITYKDAYPEADLRFHFLTDTVKTDIILNKYTGRNKFQFFLKLVRGYSLKRSEEGKWAIYKKDELISYLQDPYMYEETIEQPIGDVSLSVSEANEGYIITYTADENWLTLPERIYPVVIDPTAGPIGAAHDSFTTSIQKDRNLDDNLDPDYGIYRMRIGQKDGTGRNQSFLMFGLGLDRNTVGYIYRADMYIYNYSSYTTEMRTAVYLSKITSPWQEQTITYNTRPTSSRLDYSNSEEFKRYSMAGDWVDFNIRRLVSDWLDNGNNYGVMIDVTDGKTNDNWSDPNYFKYFATRENSWGQPSLYIYYNKLPTINSFYAEGGNQHKQILHWTASDAETAGWPPPDIFTYQLQISKNLQFSDLVTDTQIPIATQGGVNLPAGTYYSRVRVFDGTDWSKWSSTVTLTVSLPTINSFTNSSSSNQHRQTLVWDGAGPGNEKLIAYKLEIWTDPNYSDTSKLIAGGGINKKSFSKKLLADTYYARVKGFDGFDWSAWKTLSFTVNKPSTSVSNPPGIQPVDGIYYYKTSTPNFKWSYSYGDPLANSYFQIATDADFKNIIHSEEVTGLEYMLNASLEEGRYYFRVKVFDGFEWSDYVTTTFEINTSYLSKTTATITDKLPVNSSVNIPVTIKNEGKSVLRVSGENKVYVGAKFIDVTTGIVLNLGNEPILLPYDLPPGQTVYLDLNLNTPASVGSYKLIIEPKTTGFWFSEKAVPVFEKIVTTQNEHVYDLQGRGPPALNEGQIYPLKITITNLSTTSWLPANTIINIGWYQQNRLVKTQSFNIENELASNSSLPLSLNLEAPLNQGVYKVVIDTSYNGSEGKSFGNTPLKFYSAVGALGNKDYPFAGQVNLINGNLVLSTADVSFDDRGPASYVSKTYNSLSNSSGIFGNKWHSNLEAHLVDEGQIIRYIASDASEVLFFADNESLTTFSPEVDIYLWLTKKADGYEIIDKAKNIYKFDINGLPEYVADINGNTKTFNYDAGRITSIDEASGDVNRRINIYYDALGRVKAIDYVIPDKPNYIKALTYIYDENGNLVQRIFDKSDPDQNYTGLNITTTYEYDVDSFLTGMVNNIGEKVGFIYDSSNRVVKIVDPRSTVENEIATVYTYDSDNLKATVTNGDSSTYTQLNNELRISSTKRNEDLQTKYYYDRDGLLIAKNKPKIGEIYEYDDGEELHRGNITKTFIVQKSNGFYSVAKMKYDDDWPVKVIDELGNTDGVLYDKKGNVINEISTDGQATVNYFDSYGNLISKTDGVSIYENLAPAVNNQIVNEWQQEVKVKERQEYAASIYIKTDGEKLSNIDTGARLVAQALNDAGSVLATEQTNYFATDNKWLRLSVVIKTPEHTKNVRLKVEKSNFQGNLYIDRLQFEASNSLTDYNLIPNPGAELSTAYWQMNSSQLEKNQIKVLSGEASFNLSATDSQATTIIEQGIKGEKTYDLSAWLKTEDDGTSIGGAGLEVTYYDANSNVLSTEVSPLYKTKNTNLLEDGYTWSLVTGNWLVGEMFTEIEQKDTDRTTFMQAGSYDWTDYLYEADVKLESANEEARLSFRVQPDTKAHYELAFRGKDNNDLILYKTNAATSGYIKLAEVNLDFKVEITKTYSIAIEVNKDKIKVFVDGKLLLTTNDDTYTKGAIALGTWQTAADFSNIKVNKVVNWRAIALTSVAPKNATKARVKIFQSNFSGRSWFDSLRLGESKTINYTYDTNNNFVIKTVDSSNMVEENTFDNLGRLLSKSIYKEGTTDVRTMSYAYDKASKLLRKTDTLGNTTVYEYDLAGRLVSVTDAEGNTTTKTYLPGGLIDTQTDAKGVVTKYEYDSQDRLVKKIEDFGGINQTVINVYDSSSRLIEQIDPIGNSSKNNYNIYGELSSQTDAKGNTTYYYYDDFGNNIKTVDALGNIAYSVYNSNSQLIGQVGPKNQKLGRNILPQTKIQSFGIANDSSNVGAFSFEEGLGSVVYDQTQKLEPGMEISGNIGALSPSQFNQAEEAAINPNLSSQGVGVLATDGTYLYAKSWGKYDTYNPINIATFRPSTGNYYINGVGQYLIGRDGDIPVPADYNDDGIADVAVYRYETGPTRGLWRIKDQGIRENYEVTNEYYQPFPADFNGDGRIDYGLYLSAEYTGTSESMWFIDTDRDGKTDLFYRFGRKGDIPVVADFNGDGRADICTFRPSNGFWYIDSDNDEQYDNTPSDYGNVGDIPVPADYNGDGKAEIAVYRPGKQGSASQWYISTLPSGISFGRENDLPFAADFNGDGQIDLGTYRSAEYTGTTASKWYIDTNRDGSPDLSYTYGRQGDIPVVGDFNGHDNIVRKIGTGYNGTTAGVDYGILANVKTSLSMFYLNGYVYNGYTTNGSNLQRINAATGAIDYLNLSVPLINRNNGKDITSASSNILVTTDGKYIYNFAYDLNDIAPLKGVMLKVFDSSGTLTSIVSNPSIASFYTNGIISDGLYLYAIEWANSNNAKLRAYSISNLSSVADYTINQGDTQVINGQYDWVNSKVWLGGAGLSNSTGNDYIHRYQSASPKWVEGKLGKALSFDGMDDYVSVADSTTLDINSNQITLEAWVYPTANKNSATILNKENSYEIALNNGLFQAAVETSAAGSWAWGGSKTVELNKWSHLVFVYDNTTWKFYINGQLVEEITPANNQTGNITPSDKVLEIGARVGNPGDYLFQGKIDEVRIYNRALNDQEIGIRYNTKTSSLLNTAHKATDGSISTATILNGVGSFINYTNKYAYPVDLIKIYVNSEDDATLKIEATSDGKNWQEISQVQVSSNADWYSFKIKPTAIKILRIKVAAATKPVNVYEIEAYVGTDTTIYRYDKLGNVESTVDALGSSSYVYYGANGKVRTKVDANKNYTFFEYDKDDQLIAASDSLGNQVFTEYDDFGNTIKITDSLGNVDQSFFDKANRLIKTIDAINHTAEFSYNKNDKLTKTTSYRQNLDGTTTVSTQTNNYDELGQLYKVTDSLGYYTYSEFDNLGRSTAVWDKNANYYNVTHDSSSIYKPTTMTYYMDNKLDTLTNQLGVISKNIYDANGNLTETIADFGGLNNKTTFYYDKLNRLIGVIDPRGNINTTLLDQVNLSNGGSGEWQYRKSITLTNGGSALTDYQVAVDPGIYDNSGLVGSWHFNKSMGSTIVEDSSGNNNQGSLVGLELFTNPNFDTNSDWNNSAGYYPSGGQSGAYYVSYRWSSYHVQRQNLTAGKQYLVSFWAKNGNSALYSADLKIASGPGIITWLNTSSNIIAGSPGSDTDILTSETDIPNWTKYWATFKVSASGTYAFYLLGNDNGSKAFDTVSLKEYKGSLVSGKFGNALSFDGVDDYVATPITTTFQNFTAEAWVKPQSSIGDMQVILGKNSYYATAQNDFPFALYLSPSGTQVVIVIDSGNDYNYDLSVSRAVPNDGQWHYIVATYDSNILTIYVDGVGTSVNGNVTLSNNTNRAYTIGCAAYEQAGQVGKTLFKGIIDEVKLYSRALSSAEIAERYNNGSPKIRHDYQDLRFTNALGIELPYWQETDSKFWVKVDSITNSSTNIYEYYGNSSAAFGGSFANNGTNTFDFFDDFNDGNYNGWTNTLVSGSWSVVNGILTQANGTGYSNLVEDSVNSSNFIYDLKSRWNNSATHIRYLFRYTDNNNYYTFTSRPNYSSSSARLDKYTGGSYSTIGSYVDTTSSQDASNTWHDIEVVANGSNIKTYIDNVIVKNETDNSLVDGKVGVSAYDGAAEFDNIRIRKYSSIEPVAIIDNYKTTYTYDANGNKISMTNVRGTYNYVYDANNRLIETIDPLGVKTFFTYDKEGNLLSATGKANNIINEYNANDKLVKQTQTAEDGKQTVITYAYDVNSRLISQKISIISPTPMELREETYEYDAKDRLTKRIIKDVPTGVVSSLVYAYDGVDNLAQVTDANGLTYQYIYDANNQLISVVDSADQALVTYTYDPNGNILTKKYANGIITTNTYDVANRLTGYKITYSDPAYSLLNSSFETDINANGIPDNWTSYRLASEDGQSMDYAKEGKYSFKITGNPQKVKIVSQRILTSGSVGDKIILSAWNKTIETSSGGCQGIFIYLNNTDGTRSSKFSKITGSTHDWLNSLTTIIATKNYSSIDVLFFYFARQTGVTYFDDFKISKVGEVIEEKAYTYDTLDNLTQISDIGLQGLTNYRYDAAGQLIEDNDYIYAYDGDGNMLAKTNRATSEVTTYIYNAADQLLSINSKQGVVSNYTYNSSGAMTSDDKYIYSYDANDNLVKVLNASDFSFVASYAYDASGRRTSKTTPNGTTDYFYNDLTAVLASENGGKKLSFITDSDNYGKLISLIIDGQQYYYVYNGNDEIIGLTDSSGAFAVRYSYDSWGNPIEYDTSGNVVLLGTFPNPYLYKTYYYDTETGLYYLKARYYNPRIARFLSRDPLAGTATNRLSQNSYLYTENDPLNNSDPSGLMRRPTRPRNPGFRYSSSHYYNKSLYWRNKAEKALLRGDFASQQKYLGYSNKYAGWARRQGNYERSLRKYNTDMATWRAQQNHGRPPTDFLKNHGKQCPTKFKNNPNIHRKNEHPAPRKPVSSKVHKTRKSRVRVPTDFKIDPYIHSKNGQKPKFRKPTAVDSIVAIGILGSTLAFVGSEIYALTVAGGVLNTLWYSAGAAASIMGGEIIDSINDFGQGFADDILSSDIGYKYVGDGQKAAIESSGVIPNTYEDGTLRDIFYTKDHPLNSAVDVYEKYSLNETAQSDRFPKWRVSFDASSIINKDDFYESGGGHTFVTTNPVRVDMNSWTRLRDYPSIVTHFNLPLN